MPKFNAELALLALHGQLGLETPLALVVRSHVKIEVVEILASAPRPAGIEGETTNEVIRVLGRGFHAGEAIEDALRTQAARIADVAAKHRAGRTAAKIHNAGVAQERLKRQIESAAARTSTRQADTEPKRSRKKAAADA